MRWIIILLVSLIVASQVAASGVIGWVGLVVPHFARMLVGPDHRRLLPASALLGGLFTLGMDDISPDVIFTDATTTAVAPHYRNPSKETVGRPANSISIARTTIRVIG